MLDLPAGYACRKPRYSQTQKKVAVEHYRMHGQCIASTIHALGYPCRSVLSDWIGEVFPESRKRILGGFKQISYSDSMKQAGVMALCARNGSAQAIAEKLGVCRVTLYNWKNQLLGHETPASMKLSDNSSPDQVKLQLETLQSDLRQFQLERDILKTANEILEKGLGVDPQKLSNREKTLLVEAHKERYLLRRTEY
ncbi:hypothetical protein HQ393_08225 [Chitinibacter bivalviorum]|uniref:Transposase n=1 Tax=Chitinibacter bivalviorum TaxID=2739434 RepID=A0A7H9BHX6_9NEIS|nr:hypothetical protein [Chitinibacter bivalviorum]QLG88237.1 hypothetical protein HQ393_08225 [Chitinibacter bivalviorum]